MKLFKDTLKQRLEDKNFGKQAVWVLVLRELKNFYPDIKFDAYVKFDTLFVQSADKWFQIELFKNKRTILNVLEEKLSKLWYTEKLREIIFKAGKFVEKKTEEDQSSVSFDNADLCVDESAVL